MNILNKLFTFTLRNYNFLLQKFVFGAVNLTPAVFILIYIFQATAKFRYSQNSDIINVMLLLIKMKM